MRQANPLWGATRIHGELLKLGIAVAQSPVARYLPRPRKPPFQTWRAFPTNHLAQTAGIDFFTVPTASFRVLFVLVLLSHERRRVVFGVTEHPTQAWTMQQMREAFPWDEAPRYVLRDGDAINGRDFTAMTRDMGLEEVLTAPRSPGRFPIPGESSAVPTEDRVRLNHLQASAANRTRIATTEPTRAGRCAGGAKDAARSLENSQLVTKREDLRLQGNTGPKTGDYRSNKGDEKRSHRGSAMISRMIGTSAFSNRTEFSATTGSTHRMRAPVFVPIPHKEPAVNDSQGRQPPGVSDVENL